MLPAPPWAYPPAATEDIEQRLLGFAEQGNRRQRSPARDLKLGTGSAAINEVEERVFRAAAAVQRRTGMAITTHAHETKLAEAQADLLAEAGADVSRCVIGHIGWGTGRSRLRASHLDR